MEVDNVNDDEMIPDEPIAFKYVFIPSDSSKAMEELELRSTRKEVLGCLINHLRDYFASAAKLTTPQQRQALKDQLTQHIRKQKNQADNSEVCIQFFLLEVRLSLGRLHPAYILHSPRKNYQRII
jgi:CRISPR/Cas system CMR-associated protein Cmr5 small subunit